MRVSAKIFSLVVLFCLKSANANADIFDANISGFGTFGVVKSDSDALNFQSSLATPANKGQSPSLLADSKFGIQLDTSLSDRLDATVQLLFKDRYKPVPTDNLQWALLSYRLNQSLTVRAGRLVQDVFMMSEYKDVGLAYFWVRPPMEFYGTIAYERLDGLDLQYSHILDNGILRLTFLAGQTEAKLRVINDGYVRYKMDDALGFKIAWENTSWMIRANVAQLDPSDSANREFQLDRLAASLQGASQLGWAPGSRLASDLVLEHGDVFRYYSLGGAYNGEHWLAQGEFALVNSDFSLLPDTETFYLSLGYKLNNATLYVLGGKVSARENLNEVPSLSETPTPLIPLVAALNVVYDSGLIEQESLSFGIHWSIFNDLALKAQWDHFRVDKSGLWKTASTTSIMDATSPKNVNVYSVNLNFVF